MDHREIRTGLRVSRGDHQRALHRLASFIEAAVFSKSIAQADESVSPVGRKRDRAVQRGDRWLKLPCFAKRSTQICQRLGMIGFQGNGTAVRLDSGRKLVQGL